MKSKDKHTPILSGKKYNTTYLLALIFLVSSALSWAGSSVAGRAASGNIPPYLLSFIRWALVAACFAVISGRETWAQRHLIRRHWMLISVFSFFGVVGFTVPYYVGLQYTVAVNASLMNSSGTLWIILMAFVITSERISKKQVIGVILGFLGTLTIVLQADFTRLSQFQINIGDLLVLTSFFSWAVYTVLLRWKPKNLKELPLLTAMTSFGSLMMLPLFILELSRGSSFELNQGNIFIIGYSVIFPSFLAYIMWNKAVPIVGPSVAAVTQYLIPIFGVTLSVLVLNESIQSFHLISFLFIFAGIWLVTTGKQD